MPYNADPKTHIVGAADARARFAELVNAAAKNGDRVLIEKNGVPAAALISAFEYERMLSLLEERARAFAAITAIGDKFKDEDPDEIQREVDKAVKEARAELTAEGYYDQFIPEKYRQSVKQKRAS